MSVSAAQLDDVVTLAGTMSPGQLYQVLTAVRRRYYTLAQAQEDLNSCVEMRTAAEAVSRACGATDRFLYRERGGECCCADKHSSPAPEAVDRGVLRCAYTGNPCGTDTHPVGKPCDCAPCAAADRLAALEREQENLVLVGRQQLDEANRLYATMDAAMRSIECPLPDPSFLTKIAWLNQQHTALRTRVEQAEAALEDAHKALDFAKAPRNCFDNPPVPFTLAGRINALHGQLASLRLHAEEQRKMLALRTLERDDARAALTTLRAPSGDEGTTTEGR